MSASAILAEGPECTQGEMTRLVIETERYVAIGWVPSDALGEWRRVSPPGMHMDTTQRGAGDKRCAHDLPLIASVASDQAFVGTLPAGASF